MSSDLAPQSPLMQPVEFNAGEILNAITVVDDAEYDMLHASNIAKRILFAHTFDELDTLLSECVAITSQLFAEQNAAYFVYMCMQVRLETKIQRIEKNRESSQYEKSMYVRFQKKPQKYIPGAIITDRKKAGNSRPDFFLKVHGIFSVAEFKANPFRYRDLYQLQEYMTRYKAQQGYAVAPSLWCDLPPNINFVKMFPLRLAPLRAQET